MDALTLLDDLGTDTTQVLKPKPPPMPPPPQGLFMGLSPWTLGVIVLVFFLILKK